MENREIKIDELKNLLPNLQREYLEEFLRVSQNPYEEIDKLFDLQDEFNQVGQDYVKKIKCIFKNCNLRNCEFFHGNRDRRRDPAKYQYDPKPCFSIFVDGHWDYNKKCMRGDNCSYSHNHSEINLHPNFKENQGQKRNFKQNLVERENRKIEKALNDLIVEIEEIDNLIQKKKEELYEVQYNIEEIQKQAFCSKCCKSPLNYALPCGHLLCENCKNNASISCPICQTRINITDIVKISA